MKNVFFLVHISTQFRVLVKIAEMLNASGKYHSVMYLDGSVHRLDDAMEYCTGHSLDFLLSPERIPAHENGQDRAGKNLFQKNKTTFPSFFFTKLVSSVLFYRRKIRRFTRILQEQKISLVIIPDDGPENNYAVLVKAAHKLGIKVIVCPFTSMTSEGTALALSGNKSLSTGLLSNRITSVLLPQWKYSLNGRIFLRTPAHAAWAMKLTGIAPPRPWLDNSGHADVIAVDCFLNKKYLQERGIKENRLILTGALYHDVLASGLRNKERKLESLYHRHGINNSKPMVLCALPALSPEDDLSSYNPNLGKGKDLLEEFVKTLTSINSHQVFLSLRPGSKKEDYLFLEKYGACIAEEPVEELIPACRFYVSSFSATIRMAIACGIPVLNYDPLHYNYTFYKGLKGVIHTNTAAGYREYAGRLASDELFYRAAKQEQEQIKEDYGSIDGHAADRLLALTDSYCGI